jgi:hypothetical protein
MTELCLRVHGREVDSFEELVKRFGVDAFASPKRSTVPLLDYWRLPEVRLRDLWEQLGVPRAEQTEMNFEHEVPTQGGRGKSSYTDLMILAGDVAVAIEAKFTEPRYESVGSWLGTAPTTNRCDVLEGWLRAIEAVTQTSLRREAVTSLPYQLIHRTASVCCVGRRKRFVVYQVFGDVPGAYYAEDLERLASAIAAQDQVTFVVLGCAFRSTGAYAQLEARWDAGGRNLAADVRDALIAGPLLEFSQPVATPIQPTA